MPPIGRYREVLSTLDGQPKKIKLKSNQKLAHERRYLYDQAKRLGFKIAVQKDGERGLVLARKPNKPSKTTGRREAKKSKAKAPARSRVRKSRAKVTAASK